MSQCALEQGSIALTVGRLQRRQRSRPGEANTFAFSALLDFAGVWLFLIWSFGFGLAFTDLFFYRLTFPTTCHAFIIAR